MHARFPEETDPYVIVERKSCRFVHENMAGKAGKMLVQFPDVLERGRKGLRHAIERYLVHRAIPSLDCLHDLHGLDGFETVGWGGNCASQSWPQTADECGFERFSSFVPSLVPIIGIFCHANLRVGHATGDGHVRWENWSNSDGERAPR